MNEWVPVAAGIGFWTGYILRMVLEFVFRDRPAHSANAD